MSVEQEMNVDNSNNNEGNDGNNNADDLFDASTGNENIDKYIEESIRAQDEGKEGKTDAQKTDDAGSTTDGDKGQQSGQKDDAKTGGSTGENKSVEQQQQQTGTRSGHPEVKDDGKGNLVDASGNLVAKAGAERRWYDQVQNLSKAHQHASAHIKTLENELAQLRGEQASTNYLNGVPQQLGLNQQETAMGLNLVNSWKQNPAEVVKYILTEYAALGHNVNELLGKDANGINMQAIQHMIRNAVGPVQQNHADAQRRDQVNAQAEREYNAFIARYPEAKMHENDIAALMQRDQSLSAEAALYRLKSWAIENALDFNQPLMPQYEVKLQGAGHNQPPVQGRQQQTNDVEAKPMLNGKGGAAQQQQMQQHRSVARSDADWDEIVRDAMTKSG